MDCFRPLAIAAFTAFALPAAANSFDYDLLIIACGHSACKTIADRTLAGGPTDRTEYSQDGLKLEIRPVARRPDAIDANVSVDVRPLTEGAAALRTSVGNLAQHVHIFVESCTLKQGAFSSVASFVSEGTIYRVWARLAAMR